jgi:alkanesulfonate monooxygenase SsuD/methylene tetrahydromethanopterin reductase-like flavin-dependent oxidoreductase (luciferase family)
VRHAVCVANFGTYADPHAVVRVARAAESAGWDGLFLWDHLAFVWGPPSADPWVTLAAVAASTRALTLGTAVTPLPRRRPQVVAQQLGTLAALNGGRVVLGAGLGGNEAEFSRFGEDFDPRRRARLLDDGLDLVRRLWEGPIWIGGNSAAALRRAARWDGWIPNSLEPHGLAMSPEEVRARVARIGRGAPFEVAVNGLSEPGDAGLRGAYEEAGATWWLENLNDLRLGPDDALARVEAGPEGRSARAAPGG